MHTHTLVGRLTSAPMGAMDLGRWHRWTVADGVTLTIAPTGWPMGVAQMGLRGRWERADGRSWAPIWAARRPSGPLGAHLRSDQCLLIALLLSAPAGEAA